MLNCIALEIQEKKLKRPEKEKKKYRFYKANNIFLLHNNDKGEEKYGFYVVIVDFLLNNNVKMRDNIVVNVTFIFLFTRKYVKREKNGAKGRL